MPNFIMDVFDSYHVYFSILSICELKLTYKLLAFYFIEKIMILDKHKPIEQLIVLKFSPSKTNQLTISPLMSVLFIRSSNIR